MTTGNAVPQGSTLRTMSRAEALKYCQDVQGWKDAYVPCGKDQENDWLTGQTVFEYRPKDIFDTPREFYFIAKGSQD